MKETGELSTLMSESMRVSRSKGTIVTVTHGLSEFELVGINLPIYGTLVLIPKYGVLLLLPPILRRRDSDATYPPG